MNNATKVRYGVDGDVTLGIVINAVDKHRRLLYSGNSDVLEILNLLFYDMKCDGKNTKFISIRSGL